tara:strand:- start:2210 stop:2404 length:195 start_codon:yes stop_codon:yes gene_type:complete
MKSFQLFMEQLAPKKQKYLRDISGKKLMNMPLDLRSIEQKINNVKYQADGLIGKKENGKSIKTT